jgi:hypothetical protein
VSKKTDKNLGKEHCCTEEKRKRKKRQEIWKKNLGITGGKYGTVATVGFRQCVGIWVAYCTY